MSIVAHQFNILSEQLRRGIGGLNQAKVQQSESELKMEQLKYGIEKDRAESRRADERLELSKEAGRRAQIQLDSTKHQRELKEKEANAEIQRRRVLTSKPASFENVRGAIDPEGTMNQDTLRRVYGEAIQQTGAKNMLEFADNPLSMMTMMTAADDEQRDNTINLYKEQMREFNTKVGGRPNVPQQFQEAARAKQNAINVLEAAKKDPISAKRKKIQVMHNLYAQIQDDESREKAEFLIRREHEDLKSLIANESAKATNVRIVPEFKRNPYTGEVEKRERQFGKGQPAVASENWTLKDPGKSKPDVIDIGNQVALQDERIKTQKQKAWVQKYGDMTEQEYADYKSQGKSDEEIAQLADFSNIGPLMEALQDKADEIEAAERLSKDGYTNKEVYEAAEAHGKTYYEMFWILAGSPTKAI